MTVRSKRFVILAAALRLGTAHAEVLPSHGTVLSHDLASRMTIPVMVDGKGPFPFVIDTGADRSVISQELAATLKLPPGGRVSLHDAVGVSDVDTVKVGSLAFGGRQVVGLQTPVLKAANLGAMGMLGIDCLHDQQVLLNFHGRMFAATPSRRESVFVPPDAIVVLGRLRFGQLVLVDAEAQGMPVTVILDSGAEDTLGNAALHDMLEAQRTRAKVTPVADLISVTGKHTPARPSEISDMRLGGISVSHVPVAYADLETFRQYGLTDRPAMLLGMDVLRLFRSVTIDFRRRQASFVAE